MPASARQLNATLLKKGDMGRTKMTEQGERYVHLNSCIWDLNSAWRLLKKIKSTRRNSLVGVAFKYALIEYSRPYKFSCGTVLGPKNRPIRHRLDEAHIPPSHVSLHKDILHARDKILGHSDLTVKESSLHVSDNTYGRDVCVGGNVIHGTELFPQIDAIIKLIEETLDSMYKEEKNLKELLPVAEWMD